MPQPNWNIPRDQGKDHLQKERNSVKLLELVTSIPQPF